MDRILQYLSDWIFSISALGAAVIIGITVYWVITYIVSVIASRKSSLHYAAILKQCRGPLRIIFPLIFLSLFLPLLEFPKHAVDILDNVLSVLVVLSFTWLFIRLIHVLEDLILSIYDIRQKDNLQARKIHTQFSILKKIITILIIFFAFVAILISFERFRRLGTGILASAGVIGIVVGLAAQRIIGNLLAGIQIAITQPIRLDDVVVTENEWGRVEEISLTHVVIKLWDLRRLVLPISYFIEKPFQNWTRATSDLIGTVYIYVDYNVPTQAIRDELERILKNTSLWDGKVWGLEVTKTTDRTMELRAIMSSTDSDSSWMLRCEVREKLIDFIQSTYPNSFPKVRAVLESSDNNNKMPRAK